MTNRKFILIFFFLSQIPLLFLIVYRLLPNLNEESLINGDVLISVLLVQAAGVIPVALFIPYAYNKFQRAGDKIKTVKRFFISYNFSFLISFFIAMVFTFLFQESYYFKADLRLFLTIFAIVNTIYTPMLSIMICQIIFGRKKLNQNIEVH